MLNTREYWTPWRMVAWVVCIPLLAAYAHLAFRQASSFFTVSSVPREIARRILKITDYRNFWAFGLLGFYCASFLGASWWIRRGGHWRWSTLAVWLLPVIKELIQGPIPGRHGTLHGAIYGAVGAILGLILGSALRTGIARAWNVQGSRQVGDAPSHEVDSKKAIER